MVRHFDQGAEHLRAPQPLHPQGLTARMAHSHHQGPGRVVAEAHGKQRRFRQKRLQYRAHALRVDLIQQTLGQLFLSVRVQEKAFLLVHTARFHPRHGYGGPLNQKRQGRVDPPPEQGVDHHLVAARAVLKMLHDNGPVVRQAARGLNLPPDKPGGVLRGGLVQSQGPQLFRQLPLRLRALQFPQNPSKCQAGPQGTPLGLPLPEGQSGPLRGGLGDDHRVLVLAHNPPAEGAQHELVPDLGLVDEFLVQLSQGDPVLGFGHVKALVRYGASRRRGQHAAVVVPGHQTVNPVVQYPGAHGDFPVVLIISGQHFQRLPHILRGHVPERVGPLKDFQHVLHAVSLPGGHGHQVLGQHVQAHPGRPGLFHAPQPGHLGGHAAVYGLRGGARIHEHFADPPRIVPGPAQPLHGAGNSSGAAHLQHPLHIAHVDAQLHGGGGAQQPEPSFPQVLLRHRPLFLGKAAVVDPGEAVSAQQIYIIRQLFRIAASLGKCDHAPAFQTLPVHRHSQFLPDRVLSPPHRGRSADDLNPDLFFHGRGTNLYRLRGQVGGRQLQGLNGGGQADAL